MSAHPDPSPLDPHPVTRQQLDDLEALMQRILALPVSPGEEAEAVVADVSVGDASFSDASEKRKDPERFSEASLKPTPERERASEAPLRDASQNPTPTQVFFSPIQPRPPARRPVAQPEPHEELIHHVGFWLLPVVWLNRFFDLLTLPFGPLGGWLRGAGGRALLGWVGLLLLVTATVWGVAEGILGWTW